VIAESKNESSKNIDKILKENFPGNTNAHYALSYEDYESTIRKIAGKLDQRLVPIACSFLFSGSSIGVILPCMPLLIQALEISTSQFGLVISAFGLSKLLGNIPSGYLVDKYGRKPVILAGLGLCTVGIGGISLALLPGFGITHLILCRLCTGK